MYLKGNRLNVEGDVLQSKFCFTVSFNSNTKYMGTICNVAVERWTSQNLKNTTNLITVEASSTTVEYQMKKAAGNFTIPDPESLQLTTSSRPRLFNDNQKEAKIQPQQINRKEERNLKTVS